MNIELFFRQPTFLCSAEDDDGAGGGGGGGDDDNGLDGGRPGGAPADKWMARPDGLPDKFFSADKGVDVAGLSKSYVELSGKLGQQRDIVRTELETERLAKRPATADKYEFKLPQTVEVPAGYEIKLAPDHPMVGFWRETAFNQGFSQEQFEEGVATYFKHMVADLPKVEDTVKALGERGQARLERAETFIKSVVSEEEFGVLSALVRTPQGIQAIEKIMDKAGAPPLGENAGSGGGDDDDNPANRDKFDAKTRRLQAEAFDEPDPVKKAEKQKAASDRWKRAYPGQTQPERSGPGGRR